MALWILGAAFFAVASIVDFCHSVAQRCQDQHLLQEGTAWRTRHGDRKGNGNEVGGPNVNPGEEAFDRTDGKDWRRGETTGVDRAESDAQARSVTTPRVEPAATVTGPT